MTRSEDEAAPAGHREADFTTEETAARAMALATALSLTLTEITRRLEEYSAFGRRSRKVLIALGVSFVLDVVLTAVLGLTALQAHTAVSTDSALVKELHAAQVSVCARGNVFRADQDVIWHTFISLVARPAPGQPAAETARNARLAGQFLAYIATVNRPADCAALYGK